MTDAWVDFFQAAAAAASEVRSRFFFAISAARTTDGLTVARTVGGRCTTDVRYATTDEPSKWMTAGEGTTDGRIVAALLPSLFFPPPSLNLPSECCSRLPRWSGAKWSTPPPPPPPHRWHRVRAAGVAVQWLCSAAASKQISVLQTMTWLMCLLTLEWTLSAYFLEWTASVQII